jgi:pyruvate/2-oxoglutarate dehydrogenase complex dihydrolipoamide dehydrogenase (E3) component
MTRMESYDFVVIGGGSAGYSAAATAAKLGLKTVVIEGGEDVGGLCILRGCMPSKTLIESANRFLSIRRAAEFGLSVGQKGYDASAIIQRKRRLIGEFADHRVQQLNSGKFAFLRGRAEFVDSHRLQVEMRPDGSSSPGSKEIKEISIKTGLISTGSVLNVIDIPGLNKTGFTHSALALDSAFVPRSVIILGGGAIALEFAHFYSALGTKVTILQRSPQFVKEADEDVIAPVVSAFEHRGITCRTGTRIIRVEKSEWSKRVIYEKEGKEWVAEGEEIFYALGRRPAVDSLGLDKAGVKLRKDSAIEVNASMQTSQPHLFAAGDVVGLYEIVHIAIEQGALAAGNARRLGTDQPLIEMDYRLKLFGVFCEPQIATVGLSEREAGQRGLKIRSATYPFADHGKSIVRGETEGLVKLIVAAESGEILGAAAVGPEATELIHEIVVAMNFHATAATLAAIPHYHPTLSEIWTYPAEELA